VRATVPFFPVRATERRQHGVELFVFLLLLAPSLAVSLVVTAAPDLPFVVLALATGLRDVALVALVLFFLWRNGEPPTRIGWAPSRWPRELLLGVALFPFAALGSSIVVATLRALGLSGIRRPPPALTPHGPAETVLAVLLVAVVAVAEETVFRGYLLGRLRELTRSPVLAVLLSTAIFMLGHGYEGAAGMAGVFALGASFAVVYLWRGSLVAPIAMHFCQDLVALTILPHLLHAPP
jgi:membrane protease YdiL (CAAX protease family)